LEELKSSQRSHLKGLAHGLKPTAQMGKNGLTEAVVQTISRALDDHELIKVKFLSHKEEREELSRLLAERTGSELVTVIGNIAILYRQAPEPGKRQITLPPD
jgi:RNA-binding protein